MEASLFHPQWYRIADLHPKLRGHVTLRRQVVRDQVWYVLTDPADARHFRLNAMAYRFIGQCDGHRSVREIWDLMTDALGDQAPTQGELVDILTRLSSSDMLQTEVLPDVDIMFENRTVRRDKQRWSQLNPLFFRIGLLDPTPYLNRFEPWLTRLFSRTAYLIWLLLVGVAGLMAAMHWPELAAHAGERLSSPTFLFLTWVSYPIIKTLHELGHALAIRRWGGEVHKVGVTLLLLMPIPWVDASASTAFRFRQHRLGVSAAGIMVELFLAALAMLFWLAVEPGLARDAALAAMLIAGVSTLFFNGNPLMRYDGYFILSDAIDLPNLAPRSANYWTWLIKHRLLGLPAEAPNLASGERAWLLFYSPASLFYRVVISFAIMHWLIGYSAALAAAAGLVMAWTFFLKPGSALLRAIWNGADDARTRRAKRLAGAFVIGLTAVLFLLPAPLHIVADGIVWLPDQARVRPETDGFMVNALVADGARVEVGQPIFELHDPDLIAEQDRLYARLAQFQSEQYGVLAREPERASNLAQEIESLYAALRLNEARTAQLTVRAGAAGRLVAPNQADLPGRFMARGDEMGYILNDAPARVRVLLSQQDVDLVRERMRGAEVWLSDFGVARPARAERAQPAATTHLPSPALGDRGGGRIATDAKDPNGVTALQPVFLYDLELPGAKSERIGARVEVRFDLGYEAIALQVWRRLRQMFLTGVSAAG